MNERRNIQREPAERAFADELEKLRERDRGPRPPGWNLSPGAVCRFILGDESQGIACKFVADPEVVARVVVSLCTERACLLVGEPGTAKSWLSELITAAVCGDSSLTVQGGAVTRIDQLLYSWNEPVLKTRGPVPEALVPSPLLRGMREGRLVRFEEIARCPQALQDGLLSILSERVATIPELAGEEGAVYAREGFNVIATSNTVDTGVHDMSAALKRRMNFETIPPIRDIGDEMKIVRWQVSRQNVRSGIDVDLDEAVLEVLVTIFHELRSGQSLDGRSTDRLAGAALSTAEAVSVAHAVCLNAYYFSDGEMTMEQLVHHIVGSALKDQPDDRRRLRHYFEMELATREGEAWKQVYALRHLI